MSDSTNRLEILETEQKYTLLKAGELVNLEKIPDNVSEIRKNPISKPLLEFIKQRKLMNLSLQENLNYIKSTLEEFNSLFQIEYNQNLEIVRTARKMMEIYQRIGIILNQAEEIAESALVEVYSIVNSDYTKKEK
jgi:hypothetical protein